VFFFHTKTSLSFKKLLTKSSNNFLRSRISGVGNKKLVVSIFFSAFNYKKLCKVIYERIVSKRKSKKLALIAVSNKRIKQSFAIAKSGNPYDEKYVAVLPK
jgi:transposase